MPNLPQPTVGPLGPVWTPMVQAAQAQKQKASNLAAAAQQQNYYDKWFNCVTVAGTNLNQVVSIGAAFQQGGVEVWTGIANGTAGTAAQTALAIGTLTVTKGSTAATLDSTASGTFSGGGRVLGAIDADGNDVLTPGTTYTISGSSVTLSKVALESGTALYCASCVFSIVT
jgi:type II secretory pathway pseudopilin PulG